MTKLRSQSGKEAAILPDKDKGSSGWGPGRIDLEMSRKLSMLADGVNDPRCGTPSQRTRALLYQVLG